MPFDVDKLKRDHDYFLARQERIIGAALEQAGDEAYDHVQKYPDFKPGPRHELQRATQTRVVRTSSGRLLRITNPKQYAAAIDQGAKAHVITARTKPYLHFRGRRGWVRTKSVNHPGNRPYWFLRNAHAAADRFFARDIERQLTTLAKNS